MYTDITIPFGGKMLLNEIKLKPGVSIEDVELALGEMCNVVKNTYGNETGGFNAGQVFKSDGFISDNGSIGEQDATQEHVIIVTYWDSYEQHEASHADKAFLNKFSELKNLCISSTELGYSMLWQGVPENEED